MLQSSERIIRHKVGLLNLAEELGNVSKACRMMGLSRDTFYRYRDAVEDGGVEGVVDMMMDATRNHAQPLTDKRLFAWHAALFPPGYSGLRKIVTGNWRDDQAGPMQVVSGPLGKQKVHYEAPPAKRLKAKMKRFLAWIDRSAGGGTDGVLKSGIAHLWFVSIHPFDDGNGRIARAIADLVLARTEGSGQRFYSVSAQIMRERSRYYEVLERTQKGSLDVTGWLVWFRLVSAVPSMRRKVHARP